MLRNEMKRRTFCRLFAEVWLCHRPVLVVPGAGGQPAAAVPGHVQDGLVAVVVVRLVVGPVGVGAVDLAAVHPVPLRVGFVEVAADPERPPVVASD